MRALALAVICGLCFCGLYDSPLAVISPEEAIQAVRAFEANPNLQLKVEPVEMEPTPSEWAQRFVYSLEDSENNEWKVNATSGEVVFAYYDDAIPGQGTCEPFGSLSCDQCRTIALAFAQAKYEEFASMGFELQAQEWDNDGWLFIWRQRLVTGAWTPNCVVVSVNPVDGRIQSYSGWRIPSISATTPVITPQEAVAIAQASTRIVSGVEVEGLELWTDPDGTFWNVTIDGLSAKNEHLNVEVRVNALNGSIVYSEEVFLGVARRRIDARDGGKSSDLVTIRDVLSGKQYGICWIPASHELRAARGRNKVILRVGDRRATINGKDIELDTAPRLIGGRVQVSAATLELIP